MQQDKKSSQLGQEEDVGLQKKVNRSTKSKPLSTRSKNITFDTIRKDNSSLFLTYFSFIIIITLQEKKNV